jgi:hypothetical protein
MRTQQGSITKHRGAWVLRWREYSEDAQGIRKAKRCFRILGEVEQAHRRNLKRIPQSIQDAAKNILAPLNQQTATSIRGTISELVKEYMKEKPLKPSTRMAYNVVWNRYLLKRIGHLPVSGFRRVDAYALWKKIHDGNPHLGSTTLYKIRFFVSGIFEHAKNTGRYFGENPATADLPAGLRPPSREKSAYTAEEVGRLISLFPSPKTQALFALAFLSGVRKGELAAIEWTDWELQEQRKDKKGEMRTVKLENYDSRKTDNVTAVLHIRRSVWNGHITTPKPCHQPTIATLTVLAWHTSKRTENSFMA